MKIAPVVDMISFSGRIEKKDGENSRNQRGGQNSQQKKDEHSEEEARDEQSFDASIESFNNDPQTRASGLSVSTSGSGPGLKVIMKDQKGAVVRQISGEEFVKLREAIAQGSTRGKILDRKL